MDKAPATLAEALAHIEELNKTVWLMKKQVADETAEKYAAYSRIVELKQQLSKLQSGNVNHQLD